MEKLEVGIRGVDKDRIEFNDLLSNDLKKLKSLEIRVSDKIGSSQFKTILTKIKGYKELDKFDLQITPNYKEQ